MNALDNISNIIKKFLDILIKFRYLISLVLLIILVFFKINMSSVGHWDEYLSDFEQGKSTGTILGAARPIRSDEWLVQTPFYLSQTFENLPVNNELYAKDGQNMIIAYNSPVKDITIIGKPFNWGFLFLDRERAYSFYWIFKLLALFLLSFELSMILTQRKKYLSLLAAFWITYSPGVQWWFMQHLGDLVFYTVAIMVASYHFFMINRKLYQRVLLAIALAISSIGFILVIYPAFQVMFGYFLLMWLVGLIIIFRKTIKFDKWDIILPVLSLAIIGLVMGHFYVNSKESLRDVMNTVYPGHRVWTGGVINTDDIIEQISNWIMPYRVIALEGNNNCEAASFYHFLPIVLPGLLLIPKEKKNNFYKLSYIFISFLVFAGLWQCIGLPQKLAELTMLSYTTNARTIVVISFVSMLFSIWFIGRVVDSYEGNRIQNFLLSVGMVMFTVMLYSISRYNQYLTRYEVALVLLVIFVLCLLLLNKYFKTFALLMGLIIFISGCTVNPIVSGLGSIYDKKLSHEIMEISKNNPDAIWASEGMLYNFLPALGVKTINSVRFYPDLDLMQEISNDNSKEDEFVYNRYQHMHIEVTNSKTQFNLVQLDVTVINLNSKKLKDIGCKYIVSQRDLAQLNTNDVKFNAVTSPDNNGYRIFSIK